MQATPGTTLYQVISNNASESESFTQSAGNLLVVIAYAGQHATPAATTAPNMNFQVTDTLGDTFYAGPLYKNPTSHEAAVQLFYAANVAGGANTVTLVASESPPLSPWTGLLVQEYSASRTTPWST